MHLQSNIQGTVEDNPVENEQPNHIVNNGLLSHSVSEENSGNGLQNYIISLENKVQQQGNEIANLHASIVDILQRLQLLESLKSGKRAVYQLPENEEMFLEAHSAVSQRKSPFNGNRFENNCKNGSPKCTPSGVDLKSSRRWVSATDFGGAGRSPDVYGSNSSLASHGNQSIGRSFTRSPRSGHGTPTAQRTIALKGGLRDISLKTKEGSIHCQLRGQSLTIYVPSAIKDTYSLSSVIPPPHYELHLEWVYGYRGRDCRQNLFWLPTGELLYFVGLVVVLHHAVDNVQRHYFGHTSDVKCMAVHPNRVLVASAQGAGNSKHLTANIRIWDSATLHTLHVLGPFRGVACHAFSYADGGILLAVVDESMDHQLTIWHWQQNKRLFEVKAAPDIVLAIEWHPFEKNSLVLCGKGHIHFWTIDGNGGLHRRLGVMDPREKPRYLTCLAFAENGDILSGDSNGNIMVWSLGGNSVANIIRHAHDGSVFALLRRAEGTLLSGGGKDGRIVAWNCVGHKTGLETTIPPLYGRVRALVMGKNSQLIVGTTHNCILLASDALEMKLVISGHIAEFPALDCHPTQPYIDSIQSVCFSPNGVLIAVGGVTGQWTLLNLCTMQVVFRHMDGTSPIQTCRFSPDSTCLALGTQSGQLFIYQMQADGSLVSRLGVCQGHNSPINGLDWSVDGMYLRTTSASYQLQFWHVSDCQQVTQTYKVRDVEWTTETCTISSTVLGIWPEGVQGTEINACCRGHKVKLLATGEEDGTVKLFSYPASQPTTMSHVYTGHSSHVTQVCFLYDDQHLISAGGRDGSIFQWRIEETAHEAVVNSKLLESTNV